MGLFDAQVARKPDHYPWTKDFIRAMWKGFWNAEKFSFDSDVVDYERGMAPAKRQVVTRTLAAIAQIEMQVKTFWSRLGDNCPHPSISSLGGVMNGVEEIHNLAYEKLLDCLGLGHVFEENLAVDAIRERVAYLKKHNDKVYGDDRKQYIYSIVLFTLFVERVSLFSQFYILLWINRFDNQLKDTAQQVKYTRNEELLHAQAGTKIINTLRVEYPELFDEDLETRVREACDMAYVAECRMIDWIMDGYATTGVAMDLDQREITRTLSADVLKSFVRECLNEALIGIGYAAPYTISPEELTETRWMTEGVLAPVRVDFFHGEPTAYSQSDATDEDDF